jgi:hypothetical protein
MTSRLNRLDFIRLYTHHLTQSRSDATLQHVNPSFIDMHSSPSHKLTPLSIPLATQAKAL